jgi:hypothetical protein
MNSLDSSPDDGSAPSVDRSTRPLASGSEPHRGSIPPDMNSLDNDPLRDDGGKPLFAIQNTYRPRNTPRNTPGSAWNTPLAGGEEPPPAREKVAESGPEVPRDAQAVLHIVRMRALSYDQLSRLTYFTANTTVTRRRLRRLRDRGWIELWDRPVARGGSPRYAYPTRRALVWANDINERFAEGTYLEKLIRLMTPATPRQPWKLEPGVIPMFLTHTEEANDVLIAWLRSSGERVLWASSWDCPFPEHVEWRTLPQPDYVLVLEREGKPYLVFGEHDRGTESREVVARKFRAYQTWIETPDVAERILGFRTFHVFVTVSGDDAPRRLDHLAKLARVEGVERFTSFMLGGSGAVPILPADPPAHLTPPAMDFTHCSFCQTRVPLNADACPSCGAPTHQLAREDLTAEASPPPIDYAAEKDAPGIKTAPSEPPLHPPP